MTIQRNPWDIEMPWVVMRRAEIDVIHHSRGGLVTRWWLEVFDQTPPEQRRAVCNRSGLPLCNRRAQEGA